MESIKNWDLETAFDKAMPEKDELVLKNEFVLVRIDKDWVFAKDLTDKDNEESFYTTSKRGLKTPIKEIVKWFCPMTVFKTIRNHLEAYNIKIHQYCAMD